MIMEIVGIILLWIILVCIFCVLAGGNGKDK